MCNVEKYVYIYKMVLVPGSTTDIVPSSFYLNHRFDNAPFIFFFLF